MITYGVAKEKGGRYYVFYYGKPDVPIKGTYRKEKKDALHIAADYMGISYKDYLKLRKQELNSD